MELDSQYFLSFLNLYEAARQVVNGTATTIFLKDALDSCDKQRMAMELQKHLQLVNEETEYIIQTPIALNVLEEEYDVLPPNFLNKNK